MSLSIFVYQQNMILASCNNVAKVDCKWRLNAYKSIKQTI